MDDVRRRPGCLDLVGMRGLHLNSPQFLRRASFPFLFQSYHPIILIR
jgi:hypothetical protein